MLPILEQRWREPITKEHHRFVCAWVVDLYAVDIHQCPYQASPLFSFDHAPTNRYGQEPRYGKSFCSRQMSLDVNACRSTANSDIVPRSAGGKTVDVPRPQIAGSKSPGPTVAVSRVDAAPRIVDQNADVGTVEGVEICRGEGLRYQCCG